MPKGLSGREVGGTPLRLPGAIGEKASAPTVGYAGKRGHQANNTISTPDINYHWLQAAENSADPLHTYFLHGHAMKVENIDQGQGAPRGIGPGSDPVPQDPGGPERYWAKGRTTYGPG